MSKKPSHGYALAEEIRNFGVSPAKAATVYSTLAKLEKQGLISSRHEETGGRARKVYYTTAAGKKFFNLIRHGKMKEGVKEFLRALIS